MKQNSTYHVLRYLRQAVENETIVYHATLVGEGGRREHVTVPADHPAFNDVEELYFTYDPQEVGLMEFEVALTSADRQLSAGSLPAGSLTPAAYG